MPIACRRGRTLRRLTASTAALAALILLVSACTSGGDGGDQASDGSATPVEITLWHGYGNVQTPNGEVNHEALSLQHLVDRFNATHPGVVVKDMFCCSNDNALQKLTVALQGGEQPDVTYQYGTSLPSLVDAPGLMDLTQVVQGEGWDWNDFFPGIRQAATIDGKLLGVPAQVGNLAVIYNKELFRKAGLAEPSADWTWDDFTADAKAISDPATKTFGLAFPADGSEDTTWHFDAMLWEGGGDILNADNTEAAFNSDAGVQALTTLQQMAVTDGSMYIDQSNTKIDQLFNSGKVGMVISGPWAVSAYTDVDYGVQIMPMYPGGNHQTISGQDFWVAFDNGEARARATQTFLQWLDAPDQIRYDSMATGHLPTRDSVVGAPGFIESFNTKFPGEGLFAENLQNVQKARPPLQSYDQISQVMGQAVVSVLLGQAQPKAALDQAANEVDQILAGQ